MKLHTLGVIPARYGAQRFPGKPLAMIAGKPLVQRVYEQAARAKGLDQVVVATDDTRILEAVEAFGGNALLTSVTCATGTDRVAEVARQYPCELIINIQGDEPLLQPEMLEQLLAGMQQDPTAPMGTLAVEFHSPDALADPDNVKVVVDKLGRALYFTRSVVPFVRDANPGDWVGWLDRCSFYKHVGLYAYTRDFLLKFVQLDQTALEKSEKLEQLRALEHGYAIKVFFTTFDTIAVDRPEDVQRVEDILGAKQ